MRDVLVTSRYKGPLPREDDCCDLRRNGGLSIHTFVGHDPNVTTGRKVQEDRKVYRSNPAPASSRQVVVGKAPYRKSANDRYRVEGTSRGHSPSLHSHRDTHAAERDTSRRWNKGTKNTIQKGLFQTYSHSYGEYKEKGGREIRGRRANTICNALDPGATRAGAGGDPAYIFGTLPKDPRVPTVTREGRGSRHGGPVRSADVMRGDLEIQRTEGLFNPRVPATGEPWEPRVAPHEVTRPGYVAHALHIPSGDECNGMFNGYERAHASGDPRAGVHRREGHQLLTCVGDTKVSPSVAHRPDSPR